MSLATRCPSCGTIFRVVQDQLKVCEGWVRCGRCDEVFSALVGLFDLERDPPPDWSPDTNLPTAAPEPLHGSAASAKVQPEASSRARERPRDAGHEGLPQEAGDIPDDSIDNSTHVSIDGRTQATMAAPAHDDGQAIGELILPGEPLAPDLPPNLPPEGDGVDALAPPGFIRHAQRQARWQRPAVRAALGAAAFALLLLLAGQATHHFRDLVAARWPEARPALTAWCDMADCAIEAPKHIVDISVESSALNRAAAPNAFKLALTLRNRGKVALALPAVELSLTDATGQLVARRALMPRDFRVASPVLAAGAEAPLQLVLNAGNPRVTGYTVELFYP